MPKEMKKWWEFKAKSPTEADLYLYIEIAWWGAGYAAHSAQSFKAELDSLGAIEILNIYVNSPGGDVFEGIAILNMLKRHKAFKNVYVDGIAASIASVIVTCGDKIFMPANAMQMIHNAWTVVAGSAADLRTAADNLEKINDTTVKQSYLDRAGGKLDEATLTDLMDKESWLSAQDCLDYGLCDEILGAKQIAAMYDKTVLSAFINVPETLKGEEPEQDANAISEAEFSQKSANIKRILDKFK